MWKKMVEPERPQMTIQCGACTLHAGWLSLRTHAQNMNSNPYCFSTPTMVSRTRLRVNVVRTLCLLLCTTTATTGDFSHATLFTAQTSLLSTLVIGGIRVCFVYLQTELRVRSSSGTALLRPRPPHLLRFLDHTRLYTPQTVARCRDLYPHNT
jgi:hypothetical protein